MEKHKTEQRFFDDQVIKRVDKNKWIILENTHEAIISFEVFDKVQKLL